VSQTRVRRARQVLLHPTQEMEATTARPDEAAEEEDAAATDEETEEAEAVAAAAVAVDRQSRLIF
jgi:hypothetical protein